MSQDNANKTAVVQAPALRLWEQIAHMAMLWGSCMVLLSVLVRHLRLSETSRNYLGFGGMIAITLVLLAACTLSRSRLRRRVKAAKGNLCLRCRHQLDPKRSSGTCPECGTAYDISKVHRAWRREVEYLRPWRSPKEPYW